MAGGVASRRAEARPRADAAPVGSLVVIVNGALAAYISRGARQLLAFLPEDEPARSTQPGAGALAQLDAGAARRSSSHEINGVPASEHPLAAYLVEAGFSPRRWASRSSTPAVDGRRAST